MRSILIAIAALGLAACSHNEPGIEVRTVNVPTPVPCVDPAKVPAEPAQVGDRLNGDAVHDLGIVAPSAIELRKWGRSLRALIVPGCTIVN
jgi:hypothetical protein